MITKMTQEITASSLASN